MARKYTKKAGKKYGRPHKISQQQRACELQEALENKEFIWHDRYIRMDKIAKAMGVQEKYLVHLLRTYFGISIKTPINGLTMLFSR